MRYDDIPLLAASCGRKRILYKSFGVGPPLLLVNPVGQAMNLWMPLLQMLSASNRIFIVNHFAVDGLPEEEVYYASDDYASVYFQAVAAVLDAESVESIRVITWCAGVKLALELCNDMPSVVRSLIMLAPSFAGMYAHGHLETVFEKDLHKLLSLVASNPSLAGAVSKAFVGVMDEKLKGAVGESEMQIWRYVYAPFTDPKLLIALSPRILRFFKHDVGDHVVGLSVPAMLVTSDRDESTSSLRAINYFAGKSNVTHIELKQSDHYLPFNAAGAVERIVRDFDGEASGVSFS